IGTGAPWPSPLRRERVVAQTFLSSTEGYTAFPAAQANAPDYIARCASVYWRTGTAAAKRRSCDSNMNKTPLHAATMLLLACGTARFIIAADHAGSTAGSWHVLLKQDSAPDWRGWKEPGLPVGWRVADGVLSKDGRVDDLITQESYGNFELELEWKIGR